MTFEKIDPSDEPIIKRVSRIYLEPDGRVYIIGGEGKKRLESVDCWNLTTYIKKTGNPPVYHYVDGIVKINITDGDVLLSD